ncbi:unnamed protein product, partial [Mesorhabditis belari]|uniref:Uncharacterized protein n=1 Tax=Mesorhabditis belari TaxID=2138241 RepID=A0AAF3F987_9BILA
MGSTHGIFTKWFNINPFYQLLIVMPLLHSSAVSIAQLILFRANSVLLPSSRFKLSHRKLTSFISIFYLLNIVQSVVPILLIGVEQDGVQLAKDYIDTHPEFPSLQKSYNSSMMENFDVYGISQFLIAGFFGILTAGICVLIKPSAICLVWFSAFTMH